MIKDRTLWAPVSNSTNFLFQAKGYDTSKHALACFGGAGAQHACAIARTLGISEVIVHKYAGILSAYGMALADVVHEAQEPCAKIYSPGIYLFFVPILKTCKPCPMENIIFFFFFS